jgi:uncharacterized protein YegP (UPF0339 family)
LTPTRRQPSSLAANTSSTLANRFRLKAGNGETIATSEGYASKSGAKNGIESVKKHAGDAEVVELD